MEEEVIKTVLTEVLQEQQEIRKRQGEVLNTILKIESKIINIEEQFDHLRTATPHINMQHLIKSNNSRLDEIKGMVQAQPKSVIKQYRILLFPEHGATEYYKIVFGRLLFWPILFLSVTYLFVLGKEFVVGYNVANLKEAETSKYKNAWEYLYRHSKKSVLVKMDSAWRKTTNVP